MRTRTPGIYTKENEIITRELPSIDSSVLSIMPAKNGYCLEEVIISDVDELVYHFGEPTDYNYKEWYQVWNFLQYSSPITVLRMIDDNNSSVGSITFDFEVDEHIKRLSNQNNMYNRKIGMETISDVELPSTNTLRIYNRYISNDEIIGVSVCSSVGEYNNPFSNELILNTKTPYDFSDDVTINKDNIYFNDVISKEYYVEDGTSIEKIYNHGFNFSYKKVGDDYYRIAFNDLLQNHNDGQCITFRELFDGADIRFSDGFFLLAVFRYDKDSRVFNVVERYILNYNTTKKISGISYNKILSSVNENSPSVWIAVNKNLDFDDVDVIDRLSTLNTNNDTILSNVIRNDFNTKQKNIRYEQNTHQMSSYSLKEIDDVYSDHTYATNIRYILPVVEINSNSSKSLDFSSSLAQKRTNAIAIMTIWDEFVMKSFKSDSEKINFVSSYLGTSSRNNTEFLNKNSFTVCYDNIKYQLDEYNNKNRWIPLAGDVVGIVDNFDRSFNVYDIPAGSNTVPIKNVIKMMYELKDIKLKEKLVKESINIIAPDDGGWYLYDMMTNISGDSSFRRLNVRRVVNHIKKIVYRETKSIFFGQNDVLQRNRLRANLIREVGDIDGLGDFRVVCDETNNDVSSDPNTLNIDLYIVPVGYIRTINLRINVFRNRLNEITETEI